MLLTVVAGEGLPGPYNTIRSKNGRLGGPPCNLQPSLFLVCISNSGSVVITLINSDDAFR